MKNARKTYESEQAKDGSLDYRSSAVTYAPLTVRDGPEKWIWFMQASLAHVGQKPEGELVIQRITGPKWRESRKQSGLEPCSSSPLKESTSSMRDSKTICGKLGTRSARRSLPTLPAWVRRTLGNDIGLLHTPTRTANQCAPSMMKHPCCRRLKTVAGGKLTPDFYQKRRKAPAFRHGDISRVYLAQHRKIL